MFALLGVVVGIGIMCAYNAGYAKRQLRSTYAGWQKLNLILQQVDENYVEDVDVKKVTDEAVTAALQALDPHSVYMLPEPLKEAETDLAGDFEGVGLQFNVPNDTAVVLSVISGGPSEKAGLMTGDRILAVDGRPIAGTKMPQDSMVRLMRGPKGTKVTLTIGRGAEKIPFEITRDKIPQNCVDVAFMVDDTTGYVRLSKFSKTTHAEFINAVIPLMAKGMTRLVFDLRGNTGGFFDQACLLANEFLPKDAKIVYMEGKHRKRQDFQATGNGALQGVHVYVLIDDSSASASEIFAGAIQDNDKGTIVGRRSFGKGLVQEPIYFTDGSGIRLTVARFYTPSGRSIQKPYSDDYEFDYYERFKHGELMNADSIKVDSSKVYKTISGRTVYGGGGIIPDVFVPMDTTRATKFHIECNKKAVAVRYASYFFDRHRKALVGVDSFADVSKYLDNSGIDQDFINYTASLGISRPGADEWAQTKPYLMPQVKGLCARFSKVGEEAYYRYILPLDECVNKAMGDK